MHQRSNNDPGPNQQPTHVNITLVLVEAHDLTPMQQRSNNDPRRDQHPHMTILHFFYLTIDISLVLAMRYLALL